MSSYGIDTWIKVVIVLAITAVLGMVPVGCWAYPKYRVYEQEKAGEAEFQRAEQNRRVKVLEAQAKLDSAKLEAQSEIERARGVAGANQIIADGLKGHDEYLRYLWIDKVAGTANREIVYVPTAASLPILEAGKSGGATVKVVVLALAGIEFVGGDSVDHASSIDGGTGGTS